jgi:hypothetical protein
MDNEFRQYAVTVDGNPKEVSGSLMTRQGVKDGTDVALASTARVFSRRCRRMETWID